MRYFKVHARIYDEPAHMFSYLNLTQPYVFRTILTGEDIEVQTD